MTLRSRRHGRTAESTPTRSSVTRVGLTVLGLCAVGAVGSGVAGLAGVAAAATPRLVPVTVSQVRAIAPLCPTAWSITGDDDRLAPIAVSRDVAVATCLQFFRHSTRLTRGATTFPAPGTPVPPGADGRAVAPLVVRIVTPPAGTSPGSPSAAAPATPSVPTVPSAPTAPSAPAAGATAPAPDPIRQDGDSSGGSSDTSSVPIGDGAAPTTASAEDPIDPGTTPAPSVAPVPAPGAAAPVLTDPAPGATPAAVVGGPGTVSDPTTRTAAAATTGGRDQVLPLVLVLAVIVVASVLGVGLRYAVVHDRLPTMPWSRRRGPDGVGLPADGGPTADTGSGAPTGASALSPAGFVHGWLARAGAATRDPFSEALTDPRPGSLLGPAAPSAPPVSLEKAGQHGPGDLGAGRPEREVEDMVGVGHHQ